MNRKGQAVGDLSSGAIAIILLILTVTIGATILQTTQNTQLARSTATGQLDDGNPYTVNESRGAINFDLPNRFNGLNGAISSAVATNSSNGVVYQGGNYTISGNTFDWTSATGNLTAINWSYSVTFDVLNQDYNVTRGGLSALNTFSDFFSVIVVVVVFAVIIGLFAFVTLRRGEGGNI